MTKAETYDKETRESVISISLDFIFLYGVSICLDSVTPKRKVGAKS